MAITDLFQYVEADFDITVSGGNDTFTIQNLTNTLRIVGGTVMVADNLGVTDPTKRRDLFLVEIEEGGKIGLGNSTIEAFDLRDMLQSETFPGFILEKNSQTLITVTHDALGAGIMTAPFHVRITFWGVPTDTNK